MSAAGRVSFGIYLALGLFASPALATGSKIGETCMPIQSPL